MPRGNALGMVSQLPDQDEFSTSRAQIRADIDVCMGGRVAEELVYGADQASALVPTLALGSSHSPQHNLDPDPDPDPQPPPRQWRNGRALNLRSNPAPKP